MNKHEILKKLQQNELEVLQKTIHPNIVRVYELLEDDKNFYISSEIVEGGELYDRILKVKSFKEKDAAFVVEQILLAINYMH